MYVSIVHHYTLLISLKRKNINYTLEIKDNNLTRWPELTSLMQTWGTSHASRCDSLERHIAFKIFCPRVYNLNLILRKYQTIQTWGTFCNITAFFKNVNFWKRLSDCSRLKKNEDEKTHHMILNWVLYSRGNIIKRTLLVQQNKLKYRCYIRFKKLLY